MRSSRYVWRTVGLLSTAGTLLLIAGFGYAVATVLHPTGTVAEVAPPDEPAAAADGSYDIVALGDSLTVGYGDASGQGYVRRLRAKLEERLDRPAYVVANFARNGATTAEALGDLREREGVADALRRADAVVMTIGGNDLMALGEDVSPEAFEANIPATERNLAAIADAIRDIAPQAHIYYVGLYNPFIAYEAFEGTSFAVQAWNDAAFRTLERYAPATFVPTYDLFQHDVDRFLASDRYHLNDEGYERIAERLAMLME
ncbi:GDSL-type esterase/lipase family protein [Paenibacillus sp. TRM 82003]|nr:GDSL-type esterase/lipase family protein [Paenibacillus sp. TRM 82003]